MNAFASCYLKGSKIEDGGLHFGITEMFSNNKNKTEEGRVKRAILCYIFSIYFVENRTRMYHKYSYVTFFYSLFIPYIKYIEQSNM